MIISVTWKNSSLTFMRFDWWIDKDGDIKKIYKYSYSEMISLVLNVLSYILRFGIK